MQGRLNEALAQLRRATELDEVEGVPYLANYAWQSYLYAELKLADSVLAMGNRELSTVQDTFGATRQGASYGLLVTNLVNAGAVDEAKRVLENWSARPNV